MRFHAVAGRLVRDAPAMLQPREAIRGLENAVIEVLACCLLGDELPGETVGQRQFHRLLADNPADTLFLAVVCDATNVTTRTLRQCCETHIGMGPKHFLPRMHLARCAPLRTCLVATQAIYPWRRPPACSVRWVPAEPRSHPEVSGPPSPPRRCGGT
jgi:hypothetical protein